LTVLNAKQGNLLETIPLWPKTWFVETYIRILKPLVLDYYNVFHFTTSYSNRKYGNRIPLLTINNRNQVRFGLDQNGATDGWRPSVVVALDTGVRVHVRVEQVFNSDVGKYFQKCYVNHILIAVAENVDVRNFQNVKVYVCDLWHHDCTGVFALHGFKYGEI